MGGYSFKAQVGLGNIWRNTVSVALIVMIEILTSLTAHTTVFLSMGQIRIGKHRRVACHDFLACKLNMFFISIFNAHGAYLTTPFFSPHIRQNSGLGCKRC